jgi:endonuclease-3 related protein
VKTRRLRSFLRYFLESYGGRADRMRRRSLPRLREELLAVHGIGPETADSILLYALGKPTFVVDAYTGRIFGRIGLAGSTAGYGDLQSMFHRGLPRDASLYNEYHALIVNLGKHVCRPRPRCGECPLRQWCQHGRRVAREP